ncbi:MAG: hypothetical protein AAFY73_05530 [Pseudomonadota bacterium]
MFGKPLSELRIVAILGTLVSRGLSTVLSFALLLVVARLLSVEAYGEYAFLLSCVMGVGVLATLGQTVVLVKYFDEDMASSEGVNPALLQRASRYMVLGSVVLLMGGVSVWLASVIAPQVVPLDLTPAAITVLVLGSIAFQWAEYWQARYRAEGRFALALIPRENAWRILAIACLLALWLLPAFESVRNMLTAELVLGVVMAFLVISISPQLWVAVKSRTTPQLSFDQPKGENRRFALNVAMNAVAQHTETIIVGLVLGFAELAVFFVVFRITMLLYLPATSIETVAAPMVSNALRGDDPVRTQRLVGRFSAITWLLATVGGAIILVIYPYILFLFNAELEAPFAFVALMVTMASVQSFFGLGTGYLMIGGGEAFFLAYRTIFHVIYMVLLAAAGLAFGLIGVALVMLILIVAESAMAWWWCRKNLGLEITALGVLRAR